ncbi:hypothetical protein MC885_016101 [Smutsia gigantea]|nr:hypothetical protein MC885_016101 [Smutsia gigantea]
MLDSSAAVLTPTVELITAEFSALTCKGKMKLPLRDTGDYRKNDYKTLRGVGNRKDAKKEIPTSAFLPYTQVSCPLCDRSFPPTKIEQHAMHCSGLMGQDTDTSWKNYGGYTSKKL